MDLLSLAWPDPWIRPRAIYLRVWLRQTKIYSTRPRGGSLIAIGKPVSAPNACL